MSDLLTPQPTHPNDKLLPYGGAHTQLQKGATFGKIVLEVR